MELGSEHSALSLGRLLGYAFLPQEWEAAHQLLDHVVALASEAKMISGVSLTLVTAFSAITCQLCLMLAAFNTFISKSAHFIYLYYFSLQLARI